MISCPNLSNKQVAQQFQELVDVVGEVAAYDIWSQNEGLPIDYTPVNREVVVDIDQRIEDVSNMILNKLLVKKSPFRSKKIEKNYMSTNDTSFVLDRMSNVYYDITGLQLFDERPNSIEEAIEILKFNLRNNFRKNIQANRDRLYKELNEIEPLFPYDITEGILMFLKRKDTSVLSEYSPKMQEIIEEVFPYLFNDSKFKTDSQKFGMALNRLKDQNSNESKKLDKIFKIDNQMRLSKQAVLKKADTILSLLTLVHDSTDRIEKKVLSEMRRAIEFKNFIDRKYLADREEKRSQKPLTIVHDAATVLSDNTMYQLAEEQPEKINALFPGQSIYVEKSDTIVAQSDSETILKAIVGFENEYSGIAKLFLNYVKKNNLRINLIVSSTHIPAGVSSYTFKNEKDEAGNNKPTEVTSAVINISLSSLNFKKTPERLLLHEIAHSLTVLRVASDPNLTASLEKYLSYCKKYVSENSAVSSVFGFDSVYGFTNSHEFIAEYFTNFYFQELLKAIPPMEHSKFKNLFEELLDRILNWLGLGSKNAYEQIKPIMMDLLNLQEEIFDDIPGLKDLVVKQEAANNMEDAQNGTPSKLFSDLLEHFNGDRKAAIQTKAKVFTKSFKTWFDNLKNTVKSNNIIFGHPAIGKTFSLENGKYKDKFIDWDVEFNKKRDKWLEETSNTVYGTEAYKKVRHEYLVYPERHPDYVEFITAEWNRVKEKALKENKILFASSNALLKLFPNDFSSIINLKDSDFVDRNVARGGTVSDGLSWKEGINKTIANTKNIPITFLNEGEYFEDYLDKQFSKIHKLVDENNEVHYTYLLESTEEYTEDPEIFNDVESEVGDKTTDKTIKDRLFNGQESSTVKDVLNAIDCSNRELSELVSMINTYTNGFIDDITVKLATKDSRYGTLAAAMYDNATGEILINPDAVSKYDDAKLDRVILHEIIHAFTTNVLKTNADKRAKAEAILASTRKLLAKKYNTTWEQLSKDKAYSMYGLTNINEFFSELFANPRFIKELQDISGARILYNVRSNTIFGKIINWIASLFGIEPGLYGKSRSLLESIMNESTGLSKVNAEITPNGKESILFKSLLGITKGNWHEAIQLKTKLLTPEFRNWFGDWTNPNDPNVSRVVDENGEPLLVWHHSYDDISEFKKEFDDNYFAKDGGSNRAIFFTDTKEPVKGTVLDRPYSIPVFLNIKDPYTLTEKKGYKQKSLIALANGNDGMIFYGINDNQMENQNIFVSFEPSNIKSALNKGLYSTSSNIYESILSIPDSKNYSEVFPYLDGDDTSSDTTDVDPERGAFMQLVYDPSNTGSMLPGYQSSKDLSDALKSDKFLSECDFEYTVSEYGKRYSIDDPSTWDDAAIYLHLYHKSGKKYVMALRTPSSYSRTFNYKTNDVLEFELGKLSAFRNSIIEASKKGRVMPAVINRTNGTLNTLRNGSKSIQRPIQEVPIFKIPSTFDMTNPLPQFALGKGIAGDYQAFTIFGQPVNITAGSGTSYFTIPAEDTPNKKKPVSVKVNVKRFSKSAKGTVELILKLLADYKANEVDYVTIDGKELPITPMDLLSLIINFGMQTRVDKNATNPKDVLRYEILKDKQLYINGDQLYIGEEVFNISDLTSDKAGTEAYKKAYDIISNMHYSIEKTNIWNKLNMQPELKRLQDWMARRNLDKIDIIPGELSISKEDFELTHLGWLIKNKTIFSDLADQAFSNPYIYAEGVVSKPGNAPQQQKQPEPQQPTTSTGTSSQTQRARTEAALKKILTLYKHLIDGLSSRIDTVNRYNTKNLEQINNMQRLLRQLQYDKLIEQLTELEQQEGIIRFVSYLMTDIDNATKYINNALANPSTVNSTQLNQLNTDYIGFYKPMLEEVKRLLDTTNWFEGQDFVVDDETITKKELQNYVNSLIVEFTEIGNKYDSLVEIVSANIIKAWGEDTGSTTLKETISELTATDKDILYIARYMGMSSQLNDEAIRLIHLTITNAKNEVARSTNRKGQKLVNLSEQLPDKKLLQLLYEKDKDGKFTGYLVRDLNYGQHNADKRRAFDKINAEFGIEKDIDAGKLPEDRRKEYRRRIHEWHSKYSERRFIPEYYEAGLALSDATVLAKDELQTEMNIIMSKGRDKNGTFNPSLLTKAQRNKLRGLVKQKANLSNLYYLDGSHKTGTDLQIALELKTFNDKIEGNLKYTVNQDAFEAEMAKMQATLTKEQFEIWQEFNTRTVYDEAFYKLLEQIERSWYGERYETLRKERNELLRLTRDINEAYTDETLFSNSYLERIKDIDVEMNDIRRNTPTDKKEGLKFSDIAEIVRKPEWAEGLREALKTNDTKWLSLNTITDPKNGEILPTSAWTYIKPKNSDYIRIEPNRFWSELSPESNWINENYDTADSAEYIQPKRKFYDNRIAYNKAQSNATLKKIYEELLNTTDESNRKVSFLSNSSRYKIPQISARMMEMSKRRGDFKESLKFMAEDTLGVNNDDTDFINEFAKRPDGSYIKFVPTHFIDMLKDPNMITSDLIGAYIAYHEMAENYKQMNSIAPDIELVIHQLGKRKVTKKVGVKGKTETIEGQLSNVFFKAINLADMEVYGKRKDNVEVKLPNSKTRISITKVLTNFTEYVRRVNLFANLPAIFTGFTTAATYSSIESVLGRYYTVKGLNDANKTVLSKLPEVMANLGNPAHKDLLGAMLMYNQVTRSNRDTYKYLDQSKTLRALNKHFWYNGYSAGDFIVKSTMLVAIYKDHKLYNGEFISRSQFIARYYPENKSEGNKIWSRMGDTLYDAYTFDSDGVLTPKKEYAEYINTKLENKIKNLSNHLAADLDGVLNDSDRAYVHQNAYLQLLFLHRNFMIIGAHKRFKSRQFNHMTQFEEEGMYLTPVRFLFDFFKSGNITNLKALVQMYNDAEPYEQYNIKRTILELGSIAALAIIVVPLLNALADEDQDNWFTNEMAYVALRTRFELSTMYNPLELINMLNSPSAATGTIEQLSGIIKILMIPNWFGDKSAFSEVKAGPYEGMPKFMKNMIKSTPVKNLFEVRDPRAKRKYMETQLTF